MEYFGSYNNFNQSGKIALLRQLKFSETLKGALFNSELFLITQIKTKEELEVYIDAFGFGTFSLKANLDGLKYIDHLAAENTILLKYLLEKFSYEVRNTPFSKKKTISELYSYLIEESVEEIEEEKIVEEESKSIEVKLEVDQDFLKNINKL